MWWRQVGGCPSSVVPACPSLTVCLCVSSLLPAASVGPELVSSGDDTAREGDAATVSCSFSGSPLPTIVWSAGKLPVKSSTARYGTAPLYRLHLVSHVT